MTREVMQQAITDIHTVLRVDGHDLEIGSRKLLKKVITTLREALAQPPSPSNLEADIEQLIEERDVREDVLDKVLDMVLGVDRPEWSSSYQYIDAVEDVRKALAQPVQPATVAVDMSRIAQYKLDELTKQGFVVNGYAIERRAGDLVNRGFITGSGMVCWWWRDDDVPVAVKVAQPADTANTPIRVTDIEAQFPALAVALARWQIAPQDDYAKCWNAFAQVEEELEKILNSRFPQQPSDIANAGKKANHSEDVK